MKKMISVLLSVFILLLTVQSVHAAVGQTYVIEPVYEDAGNFSEGLAQVKKGGKYGFIDKTGRLVVDFTYDAVHDFHEGMAAVERDSNWGYIDPTGKEVVKTKYATYADDFLARGIVDVQNSIYDYHEGMAVVAKDGKYGFIDKSGKEVIALQYDYARNFNEGFAAVEKDGNWGFVDKAGKEVVKPQFKFVQDFNEGLAWTCTYLKTGEVFKGKELVAGKWGLIDKAGNEVIKPQYDGANHFSEGLAGVVKGDKWGFIDTTGKEVIAPQYDTHDTQSYYFHDGLAQFARNNRFGYIDKSGKEVIPPIFRLTTDFFDGLAGVQTEEGDYAFIDKTGKSVIGNLDFTRMASFHEGLALITKGKMKNDRYYFNVRFGFIDRTGKEVVKPYFDMVRDFSEGLAAVNRSGEWGFIANPLTLDSTIDDKPDNWAESEINEAISSNLIPEFMQNGYKNNITRKDFCELIINMLEVKTSKSIGTILNEKNLSDKHNPFKDTNNTLIIAANQLGIVNGRGDNVFDPYGKITRQEAAVMLERAEGVVVEAAIGGNLISNISVTYPEEYISSALSSFQDKDDIGSWATGAIAHLTSIKIMSGVGNSKFDPNGTYTRQQAYITVLRLFNSLK